jgi:hypothetical protein
MILVIRVQLDLKNSRQIAGGLTKLALCVLGILYNSRHIAGGFTKLSLRVC